MVDGEGGLSRLTPEALLHVRSIMEASSRAIIECARLEAAFQEKKMSNMLTFDTQLARSEVARDLNGPVDSCFLSV